MDEAKKKQLEDQLRRLFAAENATQEPARPKAAKSGRVRVIRRRKGVPDLQIT